MKNILLFLLMAALFASCMTPKKLSYKLDKYKQLCDGSGNNEMKAIPAQKCSTWYPVKESSTTITKYLPGKPQLIPGEPQYITIDCDSVREATLKEAAMYSSHISTNTKGNIVRIPIPSYRQVDTASRETVVIKVDSSALRLSQLANDNLKEQLADAKDNEAKAIKGRDKWRSIGIWLSVIVGLEILALLLWLLGRIGLFKR